MKRFCMAGVVLLVVGIFATGAFAESNSGESCNMENMTQQSSSGGHSGHDMGNMTSEQMSGHEHGSKAAETREPWTILYGFGGIIAVVIVAAGIMKYSRLLKEVK